MYHIFSPAHDEIRARIELLFLFTLRNAIFLRCLHRLVYTCVLTHADQTCAFYIGSTTSLKGGTTRIGQHAHFISKPALFNPKSIDKAAGLDSFYREAKRPGTTTTFHIIAAYQNPRVDLDIDLKTNLVVTARFTEALVLSYLTGMGLTNDVLRENSIHSPSQKRLSKCGLAIETILCRRHTRNCIRQEMRERGLWCRAIRWADLAWPRRAGHCIVAHVGHSLKLTVYIERKCQRLT